MLSEDGRRYIGYSSDLKRRVKEHSRGKGYTRGREWKLIYYEAYEREDIARKRERQLKSHGGVRGALLKRLELI